jgi:hypothetical protein
VSDGWFEQDSIRPSREPIGNETHFRPLSAAELFSQEPEPLTWVWHRFIPDGTLVLLVAFMKMGKSTLAYQLAVAVAQGKPFLGHPTQQCGVLILAVEEHSRDVRLRLQRCGLREEDPLYVHVGPLTDGHKTLEQLREFLVSKEIGLVILDTLSRFWSIDDENDNAKVTRAVSPLLDLARVTGVAVLLVHHQSKSGGLNGRGIRGASALFALVDQALMLEGQQGGSDTNRVLKVRGRYDETPPELILGMVEGEYRVLGEPKDLAAESLRARVASALSDRPLSAEEIVEKTGLTERQVRKAVESPEGLAVREGKGVKGDPYTYRRFSPSAGKPAGSDSIHFNAMPVGEETNSLVAEGFEGASFEGQCDGPDDVQLIDSDSDITDRPDFLPPGDPT